MATRNRKPLTAEELERAVDDTARMLKCLGHPTRLQILDLLETRGELTVGDIHGALDLEQAVASQHLSLMRDKGILSRRREGVNVYYALAHPRASKVLECIRETAG
jgi:ArsR family transcriptional regulator